MPGKLKRKINAYELVIHTFFILVCLTYILPFLLVLSISFSSEESIRAFGYSLIPRDLTLEAYRLVFHNPDQILDSYKVTAFQAFLGTFLSVLIMSLCAYPLSRNSFKLKKIITFIIFFTMLFGGGLIPSYILNTQYYKLGNTVWIYIFPGLVNAWSIIIIRTFFQGLPEPLPESAKIDGASELRIYFQIMLPLSTPVLATMAFLGLIGRWNNWFTAMIYIRDPKLYSLQYLLQRILNEVEFIRNLSINLPANIDAEAYKLPTESTRYAMLIVAAGPMLVVFPFFQKYFSRGLTLGAVKG